MTYNYASGLNSDISRLSSITDSSGTLESYDYLGLGTVVRRGHSQPGVDLTYIGTGTGAGGDKYVGLDSFGRVVDQNWDKSGTATDRFSYTYDRDSNRLTKGNSVNTAFNEVYTYDSLNQLSTFNRGSGTHTQSWDYDALGNWDSVTTDGSTQTRTANKQNEITAVSGATTPTYDNNGNMTTDETGKQYVYDAWNRIKIVKNSGGTTLKTYSYDGMNRRVSETASGTTTDLYYSAGWQVLEEAISGTTKSRYVWSPVYVDALILRDRDADGSSGNGLEERLWVQQDANFNVTALINGSGTVVERYAYDSFGKVTYMNASWTTIGSSAYGWQYLHQGGRLDASSGLYYFRNRDYSPTLGRWVTMDAIRYHSGENNLYSYTSENPVNRCDPSGNDWKKLTQAGYSDVYKNEGGPVVYYDDNNINEALTPGIISDFANATKAMANAIVAIDAFIKNGKTDKDNETVRLRLSLCFRDGDGEAFTDKQLQAIRSNLMEAYQTICTGIWISVNKDKSNGAIMVTYPDPPKGAPDTYKSGIYIGDDYWGLGDQERARTIVHELMHAKPKMLLDDIKSTEPKFAFKQVQVARIQDKNKASIGVEAAKGKRDELISISPDQRIATPDLYAEFVVGTTRLSYDGVEKSNKSPYFSIDFSGGKVVPIKKDK